MEGQITKILSNLYFVTTSDNKIYECITAISTAEEWNASKWQLVPIFVDE